MPARVGRRVAPRHAALVIGTATAATALAACGAGSPQPPAPPAPVALHAADAPPGLRIGIVVSLTSSPGQGAEWSDAAEGAQVAAYRYQLGGTTVTLEPANDKGTAAGARAAVRSLAAKHVAGIVFATDGSHVGEGVAVATQAGIPSLLPYSPDLTPTASAWSIGPDAQQIGATLSGRLARIGASAPVVISTDGQVPPGLTAGTVLHFAAGDDAAALAKQVGNLQRHHRADAVVVTGAAPTQATVVAALQGTGSTLPLLLTPAALSPAFATDLDQAGGSTSTEFTSAGIPDPDTTALSGDAAGAAASAYLAGLRTAAESPTLTDFFDAQPFRSVAATADARSHDAVVALVAAASKAGSTDPAKVAAALDGLKVTPAEGLAGPALDFSHHEALASDQVVALASSSQGTDLRVESAQPALYWYPAPTR